jgi:hypothetical protein
MDDQIARLRGYRANSATCPTGRFDVRFIMANCVTDVKSDIQRRHTELRARDSAQRTAALRAISEQNRPLFRALQEECAATGPGHKWKFDYYNWDRSYAWDVCEWCGAAEGADEHEDSHSPR